MSQVIFTKAGRYAEANVQKPHHIVSAEDVEAKRVFDIEDEDLVGKLLAAEKAVAADGQEAPAETTAAVETPEPGPKSGEGDPTKPKAEKKGKGKAKKE